MEEKQKTFTEEEVDLLYRQIDGIVMEELTKLAHRYADDEKYEVAIAIRDSRNIISARIDVACNKMGLDILPF